MQGRAVPTPPSPAYTRARDLHWRHGIAASAPELAVVRDGEPLTAGRVGGRGGKTGPDSEEEIRDDGGSGGEVNGWIGRRRG